LFEAIWLLGKPLAEERHKLAHWLLGYSPTLKSGLLLMDPRDGLKHLAANIAIANTRKKKKEFVPLAPSVIRVLSNKYLNELAKDLKHYGFGVSMFVGLLRIQDQGWADKQYDQLYGDPGIHAAILRIRGSQNCPNADSQQSAENRRPTQKWQR
jgi:hypothetical protein